MFDQPARKAVLQRHRCYAQFGLVRQNLARSSARESLPRIRFDTGIRAAATMYDDDLDDDKRVWLDNRAGRSIRGTVRLRSSSVSLRTVAVNVCLRVSSGSSALRPPRGAQKAAPQVAERIRISEEPAAAKPRVGFDSRVRKEDDISVRSSSVTDQAQGYLTSAIARFSRLTNRTERAAYAPVYNDLSHRSRLVS